MTSLGFSNNCRTPHSCNKLADLYPTRRRKGWESLPDPHMHTHDRYASLYICVSTFKAYLTWASLAIAERHITFEMHTHTRTYTYARRTSYSCSEIPNHYFTRATDISCRPVEKGKGQRACRTHTHARTHMHTRTRAHGDQIPCEAKAQTHKNKGCIHLLRVILSYP